MVNKNFLNMAERMKNPSLPDANSNQTPRQQIQKPVNVNFPDLPSDVFIFSYDGQHKDFFQELIAKNNQLFSGTSAGHNCF